MIDRLNSDYPPKPSSVDRHAKSVYWAVVRECLWTFHSFLKTSARNAVKDYRKKLKGSPSESMRDLIYHAEPFYIACDLAEIHDPVKQSQLLKEKGREYDRILEKHEQE